MDGAARICVVLVVALSAAATAARQAPQPAGAVPATVVGCVMHEAEYAAITAAPRVAVSSREHAEFVIVPAGSGIPFRVTGPRETDLVPYVGRRLEATGIVEPATTVVVQGHEHNAAGTTGTAGPQAPLAGAVAGASGIMPDGAPAHEPDDALPDSRPPATTGAATRANAAPRSAVGLDELPRLNVTELRGVAGECDIAAAAPPGGAVSAPEPPRQRGIAGPAEPPPGSGVAPSRVDVPITVIGCVMRSTPTGPVAGAMEGPLALTRASVLGEDHVTQPVHIDRGTGTVGSALAPAGAGERAFMLASDVSVDLAPLEQRVGQRVEIVGVVEDVAGPPSAHPSAPQAQLRVLSFRSVTGSCY